MAESKIKCSFCESSDVVPHGFVIRVNRGRVQRYACNNCGKTFVPSQDILMEKTVHKGKVIWYETKGAKSLYLDMPRKPEEAHMSFPLQGAFGILSVDEIFKPYLGKDISITFEKEEGKVRKITIAEEK